MTVLRSVTPLTAQDVVRRLGGDPRALHPYRSAADEAEFYGEDRLADDGTWEDEPQVYLLSRQDGAWIVLQDNGWQCSRPEVLRVLSVRARVISFFVNVEYDSSLSLAVNGSLLVSLEPWTPSLRHGSDIHALDFALGELERAAAQGGGEVLDRDRAIRVVERVGRVTLGRTWFRGPQLIFSVAACRSP